MAPNRIVCPECDKAFRPDRPVEEGQRVRCPGCRAVFAAEEEPRRRRERAGHDEDERDEPDSRGRGRPERQQAKTGGGMMPLLLIGGGVVALLFVVCAGGGTGLYVWASRGGDGGGGGGAVAKRDVPVTEADLEKIEPYASKAEVEAILGKGEETEPTEWGLLGGRNSADKWYGWRNGNDCLLVGFTRGKSGTWRVTGTVFVRRTVKGNQVNFDPKIGMLPFGGIDVDAKATERASQKELLAAPRWRKGADARKALVGLWVAAYLGAYEFAADGTCRTDSRGAGRETGTYRFLGDEKIEITVQGEPVFKDGQKPPPRTLNYDLRVDDKELILFDPRHPTDLTSYERKK